MLITQDAFSKMPLRYVWLFITDRCNLACDYCFFSDRVGRQTISWRQVKWVLAALPDDRPHDVVISGGEPLLEWPLAKRIISLVRRNLPRSGITLQTNGLLLDRDKVLFLKANAVVVEPGIDGLFASNEKHRVGMAQGRFGSLLENIDLLVEHDVRMNPTMTVHPHEIGCMKSNFVSLVGRGLKNIDVHPAFLAPWRRRDIQLFEKGYRAILAHELARCGRAVKTPLVCKSYHECVTPSFDLVLQPDGHVLPNWTYLAFDRRIRENFYLMRLSDEGMRVNTGLMAGYLKDMRQFFREPRTYREFSNFNAQRILKAGGTLAQKKGFGVYRTITAWQQRLDRAC